MKIVVFFFCLMLVFFGVVNGNVKKCKHKIPFYCPEDGSCIKSSKKCDGKIDCPNGFDESFVVCKEYAKYEPFENKIFVCANGGIIDNHNICSKNQLCSDGSDQLPKRCEKDYSPTIRGKCLKGYMECHSGSCIKNSKMCDGQVDCLDGRDESLELCYEDSSYPFFQCANGKKINPQLLCNNQFDCVDGSDEIPHVCNRICEEVSFHNICKKKNVQWESKEPPHCIEPIKKGIEFTKDTKFHRNNTLNYVYANGVVKFKCVNANENATRIPNWNVCLNTGQWRNPLPKCEYVNMDPKTNGSMGCPINYYDNDKMRIFKCVSPNNCSQEIQPPIKNARVKIVCNDGYSLTGNNNFNQTYISLYCHNKTWHLDTEPRCTKFCKNSEISGLYALELLDKDHYKYYALPGEIANFKCPYSFINEKELTFPQLECLDDGTWKGLKDLKKNQHDYCSYNCMNPTGLSYSKSSRPAPSNAAPFLTAIYQEPNEKDPICAGALIRLDLVLTAAHCLHSNGSLIKKTEIFVRHFVSHNGTQPGSDFLSIQKYTIHPRYTTKDALHDIAILTLNEKISRPVQQGIGCLPWPDFNFSRTSGDIATWDSKTHTLGIIKYEYRDSILQKGLFQVSVNGQICSGDSGSPVVVNCKTSNDKWEGKCIIGLLISAYSTNEPCSNSLTVAELKYSETQDFIKEVENEIFGQE